MEEELKKVENLGGEGLMIRKPGSLYEQCRSYNLLKIKTFHDAEVSFWVLCDKLKGALDLCGVFLFVYNFIQNHNK